MCQAEQRHALIGSSCPRRLGLLFASRGRIEEEMMSLACLLTPDETELAEHYPSSAERLADGAVHAIGLALGAAGGAVLYAIALTHDRPSVAGAVGLYAGCTILMLACSAIYNLTKPSQARRLLRRLDEGAIFMMIAGSCTPLAIGLLPDVWQALQIGAVWAAAFLGAAGKVFRPNWSDQAWTQLYMAFTALAVLPLAPTAFERLPPVSLCMLGVAVAVYALGTRIYLNHKARYRRAIWHMMVVAGAAAHCGALATGVVGVPI
jgi:hemolysin III